jgi:uncharacterized protein (DUF1778 family)
MRHTPETADKARNARLEARVSGAQKELFQRAAALTGRTLSELVIESTQEAATHIVQEHELIRLTRTEQAAFVAAILNPAPPGTRLRSAVERYRQQTGV